MSYFDKIVKLWSYAIDKIEPDPKNKNHIFHLENILIKKGWNWVTINELVALMEAKPSDSEVEKKKKDKIKYTKKTKDGTKEIEIQAGSASDDPEHEAHSQAHEYVYGEKPTKGDDEGPTQKDKPVDAQLAGDRDAKPGDVVDPNKAPKKKKKPVKHTTLDEKDPSDPSSYVKTEDGRLGYIEQKIGTKGKSIKILLGKNVSKYRDRLAAWARGDGNSTVIENVENFNELYDSLERGDIDAAKQILKTLSSQGINMGYAVVTTGTVGGTTQKSFQIRIGSLPMWTSAPFSELDKETPQKFIDGLDVPKTTNRTDSSDYKPDFLLPMNKPENQKNITEILEEIGISEDDLEYTMRPDVKESTFMSFGAGKSARQKIAAELSENIGEAGKVLDDAEKKALESYINVLADVNSSKKDLEKAFSEMVTSSINRPNEVLKNFGELHCTAMLTHDYPNDTIILPTTGNMSVSDVIRIHSEENKNGMIEHIVVDVPVKAMNSGVASSSEKVIHSLIPTKEGEEQYNEIMKMMFHSTVKGDRGPGHLDNPDDEESIKVVNTMKKLLTDDNVISAIETNRSQMEDLLGHPLPNPITNLPPSEMIAILTRGNPNCKIAGAVFENFVKPTIDNEATSKQLVITQDNALGEVTHDAADVNKMHVSSAKNRGEICTISLI